MTNYIALSTTGHIIAEAETLNQLNAIIVKQRNDTITLEDNGEAISWYLNGVKQPQGWVSAQADSVNGYTVREAELDAYRYRVKRLQYSNVLIIYSVKQVLL